MQNWNKVNRLTEILKKGHKIHIKSSHKGLFTKYCNGKVTSECIARGKSSPNPAIRKRATFAANARKWKHAEGGILQYQYGGVNNGTNKENPNLLIYKSFTPQQSDFDFSSFPIEPVKTYTFASSPIQTNTSTEEAAVATTPKIDTAYYPSSKTDVSEINVEEPISVVKSKYNKGEQSRFVKDMYGLYSKELSKRGLPKEYAKWLVAQDALETGWGASMIGNNNFGNIQYFDNVHGNKYSFSNGTDKHADGKKYSARFVNFDTIEDYIRYKIGMLSNPNSKRYKNIFVGDINGFADRMGVSGYAESKTYGQALKKMFDSVNKYLK